MAGKSIYRFPCETCGELMNVSEVPIPSPPPGIDLHLHAVCENTRCRDRGKFAHQDHVNGCTGLPDCGVHDDSKSHKFYRECAGGHACITGCS